MATPPQLTLPTSACASSVVFGLQRTVGITQSPYTKTEQSFKWPGEQWHVDFSLPPFLNKRTAGEWKSFFLRLQGSFGQFLMGDPSAKVPMGSPAGAPVVDGALQSGNSLQTRGWNASIPNLFYAGDYIQINTGFSAQLHMVVQDASSDGAGLANLSLEPALRVSPADGAAIVYINPMGVFRLTDNDFSWSVEPGMQQRMSFQAVEVINA